MPDATPDPFETAVTKTLGYEGGWGPDPRAPGGMANYGLNISDLGPRATLEDLQAIDADAAKGIYRKKYYEGPGVNRLPADLQPYVFDWGVNAGPSVPVRHLQRTLAGLGYDVPESGDMDAATVKAASMADAAGETKDVLGSLKQQRADFYRAVVAKHPDTAKYLKGWLKRADMPDTTATSSFSARQPALGADMPGGQDGADMPGGQDGGSPSILSQMESLRSSLLPSLLPDSPQQRANRAEIDRASAELKKAQSDTPYPIRAQAQFSEPKPDTDPARAFGSISSLVGIMFGMMTRTPLATSLSASAAAMNALKEGDMKRYEMARDAFKVNSDIAQHNMQMEVEARKDALETAKTNLDFAMQKINLINATYQNAILGLHENAEWVDKAQESADKHQDAVAKLSEAGAAKKRVADTARVIFARSSGISLDDPALDQQIAAAKKTPAGSSQWAAAMQGAWTRENMSQSKVGGASGVMAQLRPQFPWSRPRPAGRRRSSRRARATPS